MSGKTIKYLAIFLYQKGKRKLLKLINSIKKNYALCCGGTIKKKKKRCSAGHSFIWPSTADVKPWTIGTRSMDTKFKLDTALNLDCDQIFDIIWVSDTQQM